MDEMFERTRVTLENILIDYDSKRTDSFPSFLRSQRVVDLAHLVASKWPGIPAQGSGDPLEDFCQTNPETKECKVYEF